MGAFPSRGIDVVTIIGTHGITKGLVLSSDENFDAMT